MRHDLTKLKESSTTTLRKVMRQKRIENGSRSDDPLVDLTLRLNRESDRDIEFRATKGMKSYRRKG